MQIAIERVLNTHTCTQLFFLLKHIYGTGITSARKEAGRKITVTEDFLQFYFLSSSFPKISCFLNATLVLDYTQKKNCNALLLF